MGKYDKRRIPSKFIAFVPEEPAMQRHKRRLEFNLKAEEWAREQATYLGLTLKVTNEGHHWQFRSADRSFKADWWPSSAKLVLMSRFNKGIHVHDHEAAMEEIGKGLRSYKGNAPKAPAARKQRRGGTVQAKTKDRVPF